jgi:hypothetical protein
MSLDMNEKVNADRAAKNGSAAGEQPQLETLNVAGWTADIHHKAPSGQEGEPKPIVGRVAWQEHALTRSRSVRAVWDALLAAGPPSIGTALAYERACEMLANADDACGTRPYLRGLISGAPAERAWSNVHAAEPAPGRAGNVLRPTHYRRCTHACAQLP